jgi:hypothetical protein
VDTSQQAEAAKNPGMETVEKNPEATEGHYIPSYNVAPLRSEISREDDYLLLKEFPNVVPDDQCFQTAETRRDPRQPWEDLSLTSHSPAERQVPPVEGDLVFTEDGKIC